MGGIRLSEFCGEIEEKILQYGCKSEELVGEDRKESQGRRNKKMKNLVDYLGQIGQEKNVSLKCNFCKIVF